MEPDRHFNTPLQEYKKNLEEIIKQTKELEYHQNPYTISLIFGLNVALKELEEYEKQDQRNAMKMFVDSWKGAQDQNT